MKFEGKMLYSHSRMKPSIWHPAYLHLRRMAKNIANIVKSLNDDLTCLDIGCKDKPYLPILEKKVSFYVGIDMSLTPKVDVLTSAETLPFPDNIFDLIICTQVLQYVRYPERCIQEMRRVMKRGGVGIIALPSRIWKDGGVHKWDKDGARRLAKYFDTYQIVENGGRCHYLFQSLNNTLHYLNYSSYIFAPVFFLNNFLGVMLDRNKSRETWIDSFFLIVSKPEM